MKKLLLFLFSALAACGADIEFTNIPTAYPALTDFILGATNGPGGPKVALISVSNILTLRPSPAPPPPTGSNYIVTINGAGTNLTIYTGAMKASDGSGIVVGNDSVEFVDPTSVTILSVGADKPGYVYAPVNGFLGSFTGNGAYVTNMNAMNILSGQLLQGRLPRSVVTNSGMLFTNALLRGDNNSGVKNVLVGGGLVLDATGLLYSLALTNNQIGPVTIYGDNYKTNALFVYSGGVISSNANGSVSIGNGNVYASGSFGSLKGIYSTVTMAPGAPVAILYTNVFDTDWSNSFCNPPASVLAYIQSTGTCSTASIWLGSTNVLGSNNVLNRASISLATTVGVPPTQTLHIRTTGSSHELRIQFYP